ncbi:MAG: hypothetical protein JOS17DRAFT_441037 [Linnemannia elongata]|nr:MAG: hypothetical protein JOS17DRAFT_441037 [Linnemannia elongata]
MNMEHEMILMSDTFEDFKVFQLPLTFLCCILFSCLVVMAEFSLSYLVSYFLAACFFCSRFSLMIPPRCFEHRICYILFVLF